MTDTTTRIVRRVIRTQPKQILKLSDICEGDILDAGENRKELVSGIYNGLLKGVQVIRREGGKIRVLFYELAKKKHRTFKLPARYNLISTVKVLNENSKDGYSKVYNYDYSNHLLMEAEL